MKVIDTMEANENIGWCKPYVADVDGDTYTMRLCGGKVYDMAVNGEAFRGSMKDFARAVNDDYDEYVATDDYIVIGGMKEVGCCDCVLREYCDVVQEDIDD